MNTFYRLFAPWAWFAGYTAGYQQARRDAAHAVNAVEVQVGEDLVSRKDASTAAKGPAS